MKRQVTLIIALLSIIGQVVAARSTTAAEARTDSVRQALLAFAGAANRFSLANPQEKVYLHFDNTGYYMGETIWYTAYVVNGLLNRPTDLSRVLYVELLSPEGRVLERQKLKVENGRASGSLSLANPSKVQVGGFYEVRSYTWAMLNWEGTYYSRVFPVFDNPSEKGAYEPKITLYPRSERFPNHRPKEEKLKRLNVTFYPEGGTMVQGLPCRVAFKAVDEKGQGVSLSGVIYDGAGEKQTVFRSEHGGMGSFSLTPGSGKYEARITYGGREYSYRLPEAEATGYVMRVDNSRRDSLDITLSRTSRTKGQPIGIAVLCRGLAYEFEEADLQAQDSVRLRISKANLPGGVQQITAYTQTGEVVAERLIYHDDGRSLAIEVSGTKRQYAPFEKVDLQLTVSDESGEPVSTHLSMSVRDPGSQVIGTDRRDIRSELLLGSELRGYIEDIDYYFEADDRRHREDLDLLMLVQGWRRYEWRQQAGVEPFEPEHFVEEGIVVRGNVYDYHLFGAKAKAGVEVSVWIYSPVTSRHGKAFTDEDGGFVFLSDSDIWESSNLVLQTQITNRRGKKKNKPYGIELDRSFSPPALAYPPLMTTLPDTVMNPLEEIQVRSFPVDTVDNSDLDDDAIVYQLSEVDVNALRVRGLDRRASVEYVVAEEEDKLIDSQVRHYTDDFPAFLEQINPFFTISYEWSKDGYTATPQYWYKGKRAYFAFYQYWSDGYYYFDKDYWDLDKISLDDVKKMEIVEHATNVAIRLYAYPPQERKNYKKGYRATTLQGYSVPKEFFHVDYGVGVLPDESDFRRTLYWDPDVKTDSTGRAWVSFYNNSSETRLRISAETLSSDGVPGCCE